MYCMYAVLNTICLQTHSMQLMVIKVPKVITLSVKIFFNPLFQYAQYWSVHKPFILKFDK